MSRPLLHHALVDAYERERPAVHCVCPLDHDLDEATCSICDLPIDRDPEPCDACGARVAGLVREEVEGVICERCPTCRQGGAVP